MFFVCNAASNSKIQARTSVGIWSLACLIALAGGSLFAFGAPARAADGSSRATNLLHPGNVQHAVGYILVGSYAGASDDDVEQVLEEHGGRSLGKLNGLNVHVMEVPPGLELDTAARLAQNPHVRFAEVGPSGQNQRGRCRDYRGSEGGATAYANSPTLLGRHDVHAWRRDVDEASVGREAGEIVILVGG